jgi:hypothetical protein
VQTIPGWDATAAVTTPTAVVTVDGTPLEADDVTVSRELVASMPGTVIGGRGITAATGAVAWSQQDPVETRSLTPWAPKSGMPPAGGARVLVDLGDERGTCRLFTGRVDASHGTLDDGSVTSELVDDVDRLHRPVTLGPLLAAMPPITAGGTPRWVFMTGLWVADWILRRCGFYATPPATDPGTVLSVTAMGSMWPELGTVTACADTTGTVYPSFTPAPWGVAARNVNATYTPAVARLLNAPLEVMLSWPGAAAENPNVRVYFGTHSVRLTMTSGSVVAQVLNGGTPTNAATATRGTSTRAVARFTPNGSNIDVELRTDTGTTGVGTVAAPSGILTTAMDRVQVVTPTSTGQVGAFKVGFPAAAFADLTAFTPSALIDAGTLTYNPLRAVPAIIGRNALDLLKEQAAAVGAGLWIDEQGRVRWVARDRLGAGSPVRTLTSRDDLLDAQWSAEWRDVASQVDVKWSQPAITNVLRDTVTVWEGSGGALASGEVHEEILHPRAGEEWIMVDKTVTALGPSMAADVLTAFNVGDGSFRGATQTNKADGTESWASASLLTTTVQEVDARTYIVSTTVGALPAGVEVAAKAPSEPGLGIYGARRGDPLPVIRARARFELTDVTTTGAPRGPADAAVLTHDAGWWVQYPEQAQQLADWIAGTATVRSPHLRDVDVTFDPRLQLGDVVQISDPDRSGLSVRGVVLGLSHRVTTGDATTSLTVRVQSVTILNPTLGEHDTVWSGATLAGRDNEWSGQTLAAFDANPLRRS